MEVFAILVHGQDDLRGVDVLVMDDNIIVVWVWHEDGPTLKLQLISSPFDQVVEASNLVITFLLCDSAPSSRSKARCRDYITEKWQLGVEHWTRQFSFKIRVKRGMT